MIVPLSTITAWQSQFATWAPDMNVITYIGTATAREVIRSYEFGPSNKKLKMNVLLTTYEITLRDSKELSDIKWQVLAVDEVRFGAFYGGTTAYTYIRCVPVGASLEELGKPAIRGVALV